MSKVTATKDCWLIETCNEEAEGKEIRVFLSEETAKNYMQQVFMDMCEEYEYTESQIRELQENADSTCIRDIFECQWYILREKAVMEIDSWIPEVSEE